MLRGFECLLRERDYAGENPDRITYPVGGIVLVFVVTRTIYEHGEVEADPVRGSSPRGSERFAQSAGDAVPVVQVPFGISRFPALLSGQPKLELNEEPPMLTERIPLRSGE